MCVLSMVVVFLAKAVDNTAIGQLVPEITPDLIETLLTIISASMLVIATNRSGGTNDYAAARWHAATSAGSKEGAASSRRAASQAAVR
jgi:hypothetical protein